MTTRLLIVEDARDVADGIAFGARLTWPDGEVLHAGGGREALETFAREGPDLVVLDVMIPPPDGFEVLRRLRAVSSVPVMMLTARGDTRDKVRALNGGADDYLTKPFDPLELMARLQALMRRTSRMGVMQATPPPGEDTVLHTAVKDAAGRRIPRQTPADIALVVGDLSIDFAARQVRVRGATVRLTPTEYRLLEALACQAGTVLSHQALLQRIWGDEYNGDVQSLKVFVRRLRQKLGDDPEQPRYIQNEWGVGYRFVTPAP